VPTDLDLVIERDLGRQSGREVISGLECFLVALEAVSMLLDLVLVARYIATD
jgi:hypothetical protein